MKNNFLPLLMVILTVATAFTYTNFFEGTSNLKIEIDTTDTNNIWQIGEPQKTIFHTASTVPNVIVTDTVNSYSLGDTSSFIVHLKKDTLFNAPIRAIQWVQKLDMDTNNAWGRIDFTVDSGQTWNNIFNNPYIYNVFGFNYNNLDTISGEVYFTGTDTAWQNVWVCFDISYFWQFDSVQLKYTFLTDTIGPQKEGWMLDNFYLQVATPHTLAYLEKEGADIGLYPNPTNGILNIYADPNKNHIIEEIKVYDIKGSLVKQYGRTPRKFYIDLTDLPNGNYVIKVKTDKHNLSEMITLNR